MGRASTSGGHPPPSPSAVESPEAERTSHEAPATAGASWRPILNGAERDRALEAAIELARSLAAARDELRQNPTLSSGSAGAAVLFAGLARERVPEAFADAAERSLEDAVDVLATSPIGASLFAGFTGVAWAAEIVGELLQRDADVNDEIDDALLRALARVEWTHAPYDLIGGLTGLGVYALERLPRPAAAEAVATIVRELAALARWDDQGAYWWTGPELLHESRREQYPRGGVDLGVAHGVAGVIGFLARAHTHGVTAASELLPPSVDWLLSHALTTEDGPTVPYYVAEGVAPAPARLAWCYGDPGVAATLVLAGRASGRADWVEQGRRLGLTAARRPPSETGVVDAGFCHGSAGLAHLFNRLHLATGEAAFRDQALLWIGRTLERLDASAQRSYGEPPPANGNGLLEGSAGVALVLLSAATAHEPIWDRMFLVSARG